MKNNNIKFLLLSLFITTLLIGCSNTDKNASEIINIEPIHGVYDINVSNPNEVVGDADYVFVGYIDELVNTVYKHQTKVSSKIVSDPYTNYSVTVIENIKGKLKKSISIPVQKAGGLSQDDSVYRIYEGDNLPEVGKYYLIVAYAQPDGSLLISGANSTIVLDKQTKNEIMKSEVYKNYKNAYKNEIKKNRQRFTTEYEE